MKEDRDDGSGSDPENVDLTRSSDPKDEDEGRDGETSKRGIHRSHRIPFEFSLTQHGTKLERDR